MMERVNFVPCETKNIAQFFFPRLGKRPSLYGKTTPKQRGNLSLKKNLSLKVVSEYQGLREELIKGHLP